MSRPTTNFALCIQGGRRGTWHCIRSNVALLGYQWAAKNITKFDPESDTECRLFRWHSEEVEAWFRLVHTVITDDDEDGEERSEVRALLCDKYGNPIDDYLRHVEVIRLPLYPDLSKGRTTDSKDVKSWS